MTPTTHPIALCSDGISACLGSVPVLHDIHLSLPQGQWTSVVGPNGAGKSTLLKVLAGLLPHTGTVSLQGQSLARMPHQQRARQLAWLGQNEVTAFDLTVWDVVMLGRLPHQAWLASPSASDHQAVTQALQSTQALDWCDRTLGQLSCGERQRVLQARALAVQAPVLLMDEPLANLDPPHQADWLDGVRALVAQGSTVVSVLHELSMALHADQMLVMDRGRITHQGQCTDTATHRAIEQVFDSRIVIRAIESQWVALPQSRRSGHW